MSEKIVDMWIDGKMRQITENERDKIIKQREEGALDEATLMCHILIDNQMVYIAQSYLEDRMDKAFNRLLKNLATSNDPDANNLQDYIEKIKGNSAYLEDWNEWDEEYARYLDAICMLSDKELPKKEKPENITTLGGSQ